MTQKTFTMLSWLGLVVSLSLIIFAWGNDVSWKIGSITAYQWFPLFGLIAWTTMAGHYYTGTLRIINPNLKKPAYYKQVTGYIVLASLLLHPGILAIKQFQNDQGIPPQSYIEYVGEGLTLAVMLGTLSLLIFLSFEFFDRMKNNKTIAKYWWVVSISQSLAMVFIWVHALRLGGILDDTRWLYALWFVYGAALIPCFYVIHKADFAPKK